MKATILSFLEGLRVLAARYPARTVSLVTSAVVFAAAQAHIVVPRQSIVQTVGFIVPVLISGELIHRRVSPAGKA